MIALKHLTGWAVKVTRPDGTHFLSAPVIGTQPYTWPKNERKAAVKWLNCLKKSNINARMVKVTYAHPVEIPRS